MVLRSLFIPVLALATCLPHARAETPPLLEEAMHKWVTGTDDWAFTQRVRTFDDDKVKLERLERYDPSRPDSQRWELLEIDGKPPTAVQREHWQHRKNRKPKKKAEASLEKYFDFDRATVAKETAESVRYDVPLRREATRLVPLEKIEIEITVDKATRSVEQITGGLREPLRIALGLAKITDVWLDVRFDPIVHDLTPDDGEPLATGAVRVVVFKMGDRAEYAWTQFKRVTPFPPAAPPAARNKKEPAGS
ncbi:MAG TPA: hypothetical protein VHO24_15650 [Opitutaceae bacterium]|nr:hypothetical protein [Opitutaceae bacterium]